LVMYFIYVFLLLCNVIKIRYRLLPKTLNE